MSVAPSDQAACAEFGARLKVFRESRRFSLDELGRLLGISGNYIYMMERGRHSPADAVRERFEQVQQTADIYSVTMAVEGRERQVPVLSWAQAGRATRYDELPVDWQDWVPSRCPDMEAFAIRLKGDSMEPTYREGQTVVVMPNYPPHTGCLVLVNLVDDGGYLFKKFTVRRAKPHHFQLSSFNRAYSMLEMTWDQVQWVYPIFAQQHPPCRKRG